MIARGSSRSSVTVAIHNRSLFGRRCDGLLADSSRMAQLTLHQTDTADAVATIVV